MKVIEKHLMTTLGQNGILIKIVFSQKSALPYFRGTIKHFLYADNLD